MIANPISIIIPSTVPIMARAIKNTMVKTTRMLAETNEIKPVMHPITIARNPVREIPTIIKN